MSKDVQKPQNYPVQLEETLKRESRSTIALFGFSLAEGIRVLLDAVRKRDKRVISILEEASKEK